VQYLNRSLVTALLTSAIALSACGPGPPSADDLASELIDTGAAAEDTADCVADELLDSELDDDQLNAIAEDDGTDLSDEEKDDVDDALEDAVQECGPSRGDLEESLTDTGVVTDDQASCVADKLLDSDLSDDELNSIADDDKSGLSSDEEENVVSALTAAVTECVTP